MEDLVLSGQNAGTTHICHGSELVYASQGMRAKPSQSSFPFRSKCFADANRRGSALVSNLHLPYPAEPSRVTTIGGGLTPCPNGGRWPVGVSRRLVLAQNAASYETPIPRQTQLPSLRPSRDLGYEGYRAEGCIPLGRVCRAQLLSLQTSFTKGGLTNEFKV